MAAHCARVRACVREGACACVRVRVCACGPPMHAWKTTLPCPAAAPPAQPSSAPPHTGTKYQGGSSRYLGVFRVKASSSWECKLWDPKTKRQRHLGYFASEEDAARAYDRAAVQARGPDTKLNFPAEDISEPPVSSGGGRSKVSAKRRRQAPPQSESDGSEEEEQDGSEGSEEASQVPLEFLGPDEVPGYGSIALLKELVAVAAMLEQQQ
jgi:hypothetical protein